MKSRIVSSPAFSSTSSLAVSRYSSATNIRNQYLYKLGFQEELVHVSSKKNKMIKNKHHDQNQDQGNLHTSRPCSQTKIKRTSPDIVFRKNKHKHRCPIDDEDSSHATTETYVLLDEEDEEDEDDGSDYGSSSCKETSAPQNVNDQSASDLPEEKEEQQRQHHHHQQQQHDETQQDRSLLSPIIYGSSKYSTSASSTQSTTTTSCAFEEKQQRSVSFHETVSVLTIPNKDSYSDRIRKHLWIEPHEMMQNIARNIIEFKSENWDWRQVADDVEFYVCPFTGKKIHPCHNNIICSYEESHSCYGRRSLSRNPFFEKSKQAAMEWEHNCGGRYNLYPRS